MQDNFPSLQTITFNPIAFQPTEYKPVENKANILLQQAIDKKQLAKNAANTGFNQIVAKIEELRSTISPDEQTQQWLTDYGKNITNQIQTEIDAGNYNAAVELAGRLGAGVINAQVQGRQNAYKEWKTIDDAYYKGVQSGLYSSRDYKYWQQDQQNVMNYEPAKNEDGSERTDIMGTFVKPTELLKPVDYESIIDKAATSAAPTYNATGGHTNKNGTGVGASSTVSLSSDKIKGYAKDLINDPLYKNAIEQDYRYSIKEYNDLKNTTTSVTDTNTRNTPEFKAKIERLKYLEKILRSNDSFVNKETFAMNIMNDRIDKRAYVNKKPGHVDNESRQPNVVQGPVGVGTGNQNNNGYGVIIDAGTLKVTKNGVVIGTAVETVTGFNWSVTPHGT